jgi:hypothetical protein
MQDSIKAIDWRPIGCAAFVWVLPEALKILFALWQSLHCYQEMKIGGCFDPVLPQSLFGTLLNAELHRYQSTVRCFISMIKISLCVVSSDCRFIVRRAIQLY